MAALTIGVTAAACTPATPDPLEDAADSPHDAQTTVPAAAPQSAPVAASVAAPEPTPQAPDPTVTAKPNREELEAVLGQLAPIDSPLPSRKELEASSDVPVQALLKIVGNEDIRSLERANALRMLGLYPEDSSARAELFARIGNPRVERSQRIAAMEALAAWDLTTDNEARRHVFAALDQEPGLQLAAVRVMLTQGVGKDRLGTMLDEPDLHPSVRNEIQLRLDGQPAARPDQVK